MALAQVDALGRLSLQALTGPVVAAVRAAADQHGDDVHGDDDDAGDAAASVLQGARRYLESAPGAVLQELLRALLSRPDELPPRLRYWSLRLLLRSDVAALSVGGAGAFPAAYHGRLVRCVRDLGAGLHSLDLRGAWLRGADLAAFCDALARLAALRVLGAPRAADDALLAAVGRHCPRLRALDVSGETRVTRRGLEALCAGRGAATSLQVVDVGNLAEVSVTAEDAAFLLRALPNLLSLGTYAHVGAALLLLDADGGAAPTAPTRLEYVHDVGTSRRALDAVVRLCPALEAVYLDSPAERGVVAALAGLPRLRDVKLHRFEVAELTELMRACGPRLTQLELLSATPGSGPLDLSGVARLCPSLARLECYLVDCTSSGSAGRAGRAAPWPALESLGIFHGHVSRSSLVDVALGAPLLRRLGVGGPLPDLGDEDVADLCGAHLAEVWLADAPRLTEAAALCFVTGCPRLASLGELSGWDVSADDVDELRRHCARSNLDVSLWYFPRAGVDDE